jgi:16S rRNA processing protein RimM
VPPANDPVAARVTLARILRPRGRIGEVAAEILTDFPERLTRLKAADLWDGRGEPRRVAIRACWLHKNQAIFHFEGSDSINDAEKFVGLEVQVPLAERVTLPPGSYFVNDLIGCEVWEQGACLGTVRSVQPTGENLPGTPLLVVEMSRGELLLPLAEEICVRVDVAARRIEARLPDGLRDLNPDS